MEKLFLSLFVFISINGIAQQQRDFLTKENTEASVAQILDNDNSWIIYPAYADRRSWNKIPGELRRQFINKANRALSYQYQFVPASAYLAYIKTGDRQIQEKPYAANLGAVTDLLMGELMEGKGRFIPQLIKGIDNLCAMQTWALSAHLSLQKSHKEGIIDSTDNIIDLGAGRTGSVLAWTYYFLHAALDKVDPSVSRKLVDELERRIITPYEQRNDFWWMAFKNPQFVNNWNVWCNYNSLTCILLVEKDPERKAALVYKTMTSVDHFLNYYKQDGACEEGPSYWSEAGGNLYHYLQLLKEATKGKINLFNQPLVKNIAAYIYKAYIGNNYFVNFADAHPKASPDADLVYDFGKAVDDKTMQAFGAWLAQWQKYPRGDVWDIVNYLFEYNEVQKYPPAQSLLEDVYYPQTQVVAARDHANSTNGFYFAGKGGNNGESHNHNDVGEFILFYNNVPLFIDIGSGTYTAQTFSSKRFDLFNTRSLNHNVPLINGIEQRDGRKFTTSSFDYRVSAAGVTLSTEIEKAYPQSSSADQWERSYVLDRGKDFLIKDDFQLKENNGKCTDNFVTPILPKQLKDGLLEFDVKGERIYMRYDPATVSYNLVTMDITDPAVIGQWGDKLYRVELTFNKHLLNCRNIITITK